MVARMTASSTPPLGRLVIPAVPALVAGLRRAVVVTPDGEIDELTTAQARAFAEHERPLLCHRKQTASRLGIATLAGYDVLELFAFVRPAQFCVPTPRGLAQVLGLPIPADAADEALTLVAATRQLLQALIVLPRREHARAKAIAEAMMFVTPVGGEGWSWGPSVLAALAGDGPRGNPLSGLRVWEHLPEFSEHAPAPPPANHAVDPAEARARLSMLLAAGDKGEHREDRPQQADFASACTAAFAPRDRAAFPKVVMAEAGTGVGKTLGYIAPASVWAEKNDGCVWVSTYTRALQRQLDTELDRLYPDPLEKARKVVVRKGRENYLCLLNLEEAVSRIGANPAQAVALGLMARWALATRDGDMVGGDFPGWLVDLLGGPNTLGLMDRRGECTFSACAHYSRCFIERGIRRAKRAHIVVANHALVMVQAALASNGGGDDGGLPLRTVFDEGHHVFDAADSAFSAHLTGFEAADLRRWLLGPEETGKSRAKGLRRRAEELVIGNEIGIVALDDILHAARVLPGPGWTQRLGNKGLVDQPYGPSETFLSLVREQVHARASDPHGPYSLETELYPPIPGLLAAAAVLAEALETLEVPLKGLATMLTRRLTDEADTLDTQTRQRLEGLARSLERRALLPVMAWRAMLQALLQVPSSTTPGQFVDWLAIDRVDGREVDLGMHRHWIDPTEPFARTLSATAHGALITSATLRDGSGDEEADWKTAEARIGGPYLAEPPLRAAVASPFDYPANTRVLVVTDVRKDDLDQVAAAYQHLFEAAGGGGLGLFTAISRLKAVHKRINEPLDEAGLPLYAQHIDALDTGTLVDIFRAEEDACLLGTDAIRDGVDVPGRSLRLIVFDRVPWPRPDILHKARRKAFGGRVYDDSLARLKLKQAFGRLIRRASDRGVFVLLDPMMPSRLFGAFPPGVTVERVGLAEAIAVTADFLSPA